MLRHFGFILLIFTLAAPAYADAPPSDAQILHLLNRISFGPAPGDFETVRRMGMQDYIERQLHPDLIELPNYLKQRLDGLPTLEASLPSLADDYWVQGKKQMSEEDKKKANQRENTVVRELIDAKITRAAFNPAQLQEVMTDFWFNHFNVFAEKGLDKIFIGAYERDAIRPYALGKFRDLLQATARHPAMLFYLDNWLNTDPNSPAARGKKIGINENYAREVMELHTLGVTGGYTQQDVTTLAHVLTGWGLGEGKDPADKAVFHFEPRRHDFGGKILLNKEIRGSGAAEVEAVLDMLAQEPATANHISYELAQYFVADNPPLSLVKAMAETFRSSKGDIAAVLRTMFYAQEFWDAQYSQNKFKPPFRYVVSAMRAAYILPGDTNMLQGAIAQMGEPLYRCQTPNGYANTNDQWLNSDALLKRIDFAKNLSRYAKGNLTNQLLSDFGNSWSDNTLKTVKGADAGQQLTLIMGSPEFVYY